MEQPEGNSGPGLPVTLVNLVWEPFEEESKQSHRKREDTRGVWLWHSRLTQCQYRLARENQSAKQKDDYIMMKQEV